jgi:hypothetical protein
MIGDSARVSVTVAVSPALAFEIFTEEIDRWWRRGLKFRQTHGRGGFLRIEPEVGGRRRDAGDSDPSRLVRLARRPPGPPWIAGWRFQPDDRPLVG